MQVMKTILLLALLGLALSSIDRRSAVEESFSFGSIFRGIKRAATSTVNRVKSGVNTAVRATTKVANTAVKHTVSGVNTAVKQTQKGVVFAVDQTKNGINIALDQTKKAVVDQAINNGLKVGVQWTQDQVLKAVDESKKAFVSVGKMTEQASKDFANEVKKVSQQVGKNLDPRQIKTEHLLKVLDGVRVATGPMQPILTHPAVQLVMSKMPPKLQIAHKVLVLAVKCINDPEHARDHLMEANPIAGLVTNFVVNTIKDPDHWQDHLVETAPAMGEALAEIAKEQAMKKLKAEAKVAILPKKL